MVRPYLPTPQRWCFVGLALLPSLLDPSDLVPGSCFLMQQLNRRCSDSSPSRSNGVMQLGSATGRSASPSESREPPRHSKPGWTPQSTHSGSWELQHVLVVAASAAVGAFMAFAVSSSPVSAAQVNDSVTGFADFAAKGGAMDVNPACFITDCGTQTKECFVDDARCLKGALCLSRCRGGQECATQCFAEYGCKRLDAWLNCTVERKKCVSTPAQLLDVKKWFSEDLPKRQAEFDPAQWRGTWYKVRGYNPKYDCYACQTNSFSYESGAPTMKAEVKLRLPRLKSSGFWENSLEENLKVSPPSSGSTFSARGQIFGLTFDEDWYVVGGDEDFWLVAYKGASLQDIYEGAFIYTRAPTLSAEVEVKAKKLAEANGYTWSKFCVVDNSCPAQAAGAVAEGDARLDWDDIPDLIEWFAPGSIPKKQDFSGRYD